MDDHETALAPALDLALRLAARAERVAARACRRAALEVSAQQRRQDEAILTQYPRPRTRADCADGPRPCAWVGCEHHLYLQVSDTGRLKLQHGEPWELPETCALDVSERGGLTLEAVSKLLGVTRERVRQLEERGLMLMRASGAARLR